LEIDLGDEDMSLTRWCGVRRKKKKRLRGVFAQDEVVEETLPRSVAFMMNEQTEQSYCGLRR